jgi:hypothetical protein
VSDPDRSAIVLPIVWLALMGVLTWYVFGQAALDDYVGWIPLVVVAQIPAYLALASAPLREPFTRAQAAALALPAASMVALAAFFPGMLAGRLIWPALFLELRPFIVAFALAAVAFGLCVVLFTRALGRAGHPPAARRVLGAVTLAAAGGVLALVADRAAFLKEPGLWLAAAAPFAWTLPLWALALRRSDERNRAAGR